jgi:hypothetical protein
MSVVVEKAPVRRWRRSFTAEFKRDAVAMVLDDERSVAEVAKALGSARRTWSGRPRCTAFHTDDVPAVKLLHPSRSSDSVRARSTRVPR